MITAQTMRERNDQLKKDRASATLLNIEKRLFSPATMAVLDHLSKSVEERHTKGFPYNEDLLTVNIEDDVNQFELLSVLRNLGYSVTLSCSSNPNNEQITIKW